MAPTTSATAHQSADWATLAEELDCWLDANRQATFWWRDDDVTQPSQALDRLLDVADGTPLALAAIPRAAGPKLAERLAGASNITVMQHGYAHSNHAPPRERKAEYGKHRPLLEMANEIARGAERLRDVFSEMATTTFVPPWNRISDELVALLPDAGVSALSSIGPCHSDHALPQINVHVDIIDWRGQRDFRGRAAIECVIDNLSQRRSGDLDATAATGLLTHHLDHDAACWSFVADLLTLTEAPSRCPLGECNGRARKPLTERYHYPLQSLVGDYFRAIAGITLSALPLFVVSVGPVVTTLLSALLVLFSVFAARTLLRHATVIETTTSGITSVGPAKRNLAWDGVNSVQLSYFSTWRDKSKGWMQLKLAGREGTIRIDSNLNGFDEVAAVVAECAARNDALMNDVTIGNFGALGITVGGSGGSTAKLGDVGG